jgi:hypothetical protein
MTQEEIQNLVKSKTKRFCKKCNKYKTCDKFFIKKSKNENHWRFNTPCKECHKKEYQNDSRKRYLKFYSKKRNFGISECDYNKMLQKQNNCCSICNVNKADIKRDFAIDHCHITGEIRGLLCANCNTGIGMLKDDINILIKAIEYLTLWKS